MKTVVIFGGSGFIGQNIIRRLSKKGYKIIVPYQRPAEESKLKLYGEVGQIIPFRFKKLEDDRIVSVIHNADIILNLKTIWQEKKPYFYDNLILAFNKKLVDFINNTNSDKLYIFFSGLGIKEKSLSKRVSYIAKAEKYILNNYKNSVIVRPGFVLGYNDQFLSKLLPIFKMSLFIPLFGSQDVKLQPVFVDDVAKAIETILEKRVNDTNIYELGGPEIFTYRSLYGFIIEKLGLKRKFIRIPFKIAIFLASIIEKTPLNLITKDQVILFTEDNICTNQLGNFNKLNISPSDTKEIIKKII